MKNFAVATLVLALAGCAAPAPKTTQLHTSAARVTSGMPAVGDTFTAKVSGSGPIYFQINSAEYTGCAVLPEFNQYGAITHTGRFGDSVRFAGGGGSYSFRATFQERDTGMVDRLAGKGDVTVVVKGYSQNPTWGSSVARNAEAKGRVQVCLAVEVKTPKGNLAHLIAEEGAGIACQGAYKTPDSKFWAAYAAGAEQRSDRLSLFKAIVRPDVQSGAIRSQVNWLNERIADGKLKQAAGIGNQRWDQDTRLANSSFSPEQKVLLAMGTWTQLEMDGLTDAFVKEFLTIADGCYLPAVKQGDVWDPALVRGKQ